MARKSARAKRKRVNEAAAPSVQPLSKSRIVSYGRWHRDLRASTVAGLNAQEAAFWSMIAQRRARWQADYGIALPTTVDEWERMLARVGLSAQEIDDVLTGIPDIDLVINHVEGYLDRAYVDGGSSRFERTKALLAEGQSVTGPVQKVRKPGGWTRKELVEEAIAQTHFSATVFDEIRKAAGIEPAAVGGAGTHRRFSKAQLRQLIEAVLAGKRRYKEGIVKAWRDLLDE